MSFQCTRKLGGSPKPAGESGQAALKGRYKMDFVVYVVADDSYSGSLDEKIKYVTLTLTEAQELRDYQTDLEWTVYRVSTERGCTTVKA